MTNNDQNDQAEIDALKAQIAAKEVTWKAEISAKEIAWKAEIAAKEVAFEAQMAAKEAEYLDNEAKIAQIKQQIEATSKKRDYLKEKYARIHEIKEKIRRSREVIAQKRGEIARITLDIAKMDTKSTRMNAQIAVLHDLVLDRPDYHPEIKKRLDRMEAKLARRDVKYAKMKSDPATIKADFANESAQNAIYKNAITAFDEDDMITQLGELEEGGVVHEE
jgi:chromosome segregation ATPase